MLNEIVQERVNRNDFFIKSVCVESQALFIINYKLYNYYGIANSILTIIRNILQTSF